MDAALTDPRITNQKVRTNCIGIFINLISFIACSLAVMRASALVQGSKDVPFIMCALAEGRGRFERVVVTKSRPCQPLVDRFPEIGVVLQALIEELFDFLHVRIAVEG
jgi:hypothetical protein